MLGSVLHRVKRTTNFIPAGDAFSPACFVMPSFSLANYAGLFSFQLLTLHSRITHQVILAFDCFSLTHQDSNYFNSTVRS